MYVLAAETEDCMKAWVTKLTNTCWTCITTVIRGLECPLADLQLKETSMTSEVLSESSSKSESVEEAITSSA